MSGKIDPDSGAGGGFGSWMDDPRLRKALERIAAESEAQGDPEQAKILRRLSASGAPWAAKSQAERLGDAVGMTPSFPVIPAAPPSKTPVGDFLRGEWEQQKRGANRLGRMLGVVDEPAEEYQPASTAPRSPGAGVPGPMGHLANFAKETATVAAPPEPSQSALMPNLRPEALAATAEIDQGYEDRRPATAHLAEPAGNPLIQRAGAFLRGKGRGLLQGMRDAGAEVGRFVSEEDYLPQPAPSPQPSIVDADQPAVRAQVQRAAAALQKGPVVSRKPRMAGDAEVRPFTPLAGKAPAPSDAEPEVESVTSQTRTAPATAEIPQPKAGRSLLDEALDEADLRRRSASWARIGATAIGRGNDRIYDAMDADAEAPVRDAMMKEARRERLEAIARGLAAGKSQEQLRRELQALEFAHKEKLARMAGQAKVDAARARGGGKRGGLTPYQEMMADDRVDRYAQKASTVLAPFGDMATDLETVLGAAQEKDVAGIGPGAGRVPDMLTSEKGVANRRAARRLVENLLRAQSGLAASDREQLRKLASTSLADSAADADWRAGAAELARYVQKAMRNREAGFPAAAIKRFGERGGITSSSIPGAEGGGRAAQDDEAVAWARAHPDDPRAARILELNGVR